MIRIKVEKINVEKDFDRTKIYTPEDITDQVVMPIIDVERLDTTLDTSSLTLDNYDKNGIEPFTKMIITLTNENGAEEKIYRFVYKDTPELLTYGENNNKYRHNVELIEPSKWLERFDVDNTTITNFLAFLYQDTEHIFPINAPFERNITGSRLGWLVSDAYKSNVRLFDIYYQGTTIDPRVELDCVYGFTWKVFGISLGSRQAKMDFNKATVTKPDGTVVELREFISGSGYRWKNDSDLFTFDQDGIYTFKEHYDAIFSAGTEIFNAPRDGYLYIEYTWTVKVIKQTTLLEKYPTRYNIAQVINLILQKVGNETTILRNGLDTPLFSLDPNLTEKLSNLTSPEFTFTQNTLFGVLLQIGTEIHAIPRLIPSKAMATDDQGNTYIDDWSSWNIITFDFLGGDDAVVRGEIVASEHDFDGDNYTTDFVSNVQNSFQTNNYDYIALTEPYENGFISTRTIDENYEISNNSAVIKTSRPIQRIIELIVQVEYRGETHNLDISRYVKESTDYSLLLDYAETQEQFQGLGTKNMAVYYTRGTNLIQGLDYIQPTKYSTEVIGLNNAINNIIALELGLSGIFTSWALKDLMFKIKYVPYYNLKIKQFKPYITNNSGNNELFYNQQQTQTVDIETLGENMKGALLRTANEEITNTEYFKDFTNIVKTGQLTADGYYAYQVNREITNRRIKATTTFSKNFNKWNEYIAIKKNYREWEISERESIETNPCYNEFCIISTEADWQRGRLDADSLAVYEDYLSKIGGFSSPKAMAQIYAKLTNATDFEYKSIAWVVGTTISSEYQAGGTYKEVRNTFLLPCACFSFGNSIALNFGALDNYAIGTYSRDKGTIAELGGYALENYVRYSDKYGQAQYIELSFGYDEAKKNGFNTRANALVSSKEFYALKESELDTDAIMLDYRANSFIINKDSRQKLNFTGQLHFLTENENIWIGKGFAQLMPFVGNTQKGGLKFVTFSQRPDKFLSKVDTSIWTEQAMPNCIKNDTLKYIQYEPTTVEKACVGYGLVDSQNRVVLYYDQELAQGEQTKPLYFEFRRKI